MLADVAVGAWEAQRRRPGDSVDLRDHADEIVWAATRAPSYRNTQPWLIRVAARQVEVYADRSRSCPVADPEGRELFLGLGAAVFGVRLALSLAASAAGVAGAFLSELIEVPLLRRRLQRELDLPGCPQVLLGLGRPQEPVPPPSPRRSVADVLSH